MNGPLRIWYCGRCRHPLRCEPKRAIPLSCKCKVPTLPKTSTLVWHA